MACKPHCLRAVSVRSGFGRPPNARRSGIWRLRASGRGRAARALRGARSRSRRLYACARIRRGDPAHAGRVHAVTGVRHPAGTGGQPRHLAGRSRQSALRAIRPQRRRSDWAAAPQDRARPQGAATHRHRPRRGLSVRRADKDPAVRPEAFDRSPGARER
jgi:hypothetical protein